MGSLLARVLKLPSKLYALISLFLCLVFSSDTESDRLLLWPKPLSIKWNSSSCTDHFSLESLHLHVDPSLPQDTQNYIINAVELSKKSWGCTTSNANANPSTGKARSFSPSLNISITDATTSALVSPAKLLPIADSLTEDYTIQITQHMDIYINASTILGVQWALASLASLAGGTCSLSCLPLSITDAPRFKHRGLLIDTSRNFQPLDNLHQLIDAMAATKLNVLHWHISDSQSFPLQVHFSPNITQTYSPDLSYSQAQVEEFIEYAWARGIRVMPEFDMPGHTAILGKSYPDLTACIDHQPWDEMCRQPPCGQLLPNTNNNNNASLALVSNLITEMAGLFADRMFSTGCDEVNFHCWEEKVGSSRAQTPQQQLLHFQAAVADMVLNDINRTFVVWEDSFTQYNLSHTAALPKGSTLIVWATPDAVPDITKTGLYNVIFAPYNAWYLDCGLGTAESGPKSWCANNKNGGINTWEDAYRADPLMYGGIEERILGGEAVMWTEHVLPSILDYVIWPRAAAVGERLWSSKNCTKDIKDAERRLLHFRNRVLKVGLGMNPSPLDWNGQNFRYTILPRWCDNRTAFDSKGDDYCAPAQEYCCGKVPLSFESLVDTGNSSSSSSSNNRRTGSGSMVPVWLSAVLKFDGMITFLIHWLGVLL